MPVFGLDSKYPHANDALALTFFPRWQKQIYTKICGFVRSDRYVEPFSLLGAAPLMRRFAGSVAQSKFNSWKLQIPNILLKSKSLIARQDIEHDQKRFIPKVISAIGVTLVESPTYQIASRMLLGHTQSSCYATSDVDGIQYQTTFEKGIPTFSAAHNQFDGSLQSNIVTGSLPTTKAALALLPLATVVGMLIDDVTALIERISSIRDDKGRYMFADFDSAEQLTIVVPPCLRAAAQFAFKTPGAVFAGSQTSGNGTSGSTSTFQLVKDVLNFGLLGKTIPNVEDGEMAEISPEYETEWYALIDGDLVRPYYWQRYVPPVGSDVTAPAAYDAAEVANQMVADSLKAGKELSIEAADWYASAMIDHNLNAIGSNAQQSVVDTEQFFISPRQRGTIINGPWFTQYKVVPAGQST